MPTTPTVAPGEESLQVRPRRIVGLGPAGVLVWAVAAAAFLVAGVTGHDRPGPSGGGAAPTTVPGSARVAPAADPGTHPTRLHIPEIGVDTRLMELDLTATGELEVPPLSQAGTAGWYERSPDPGDTGPAVIAGHVDSRTGPAVFFRLHELQAGDRVRVARSDHRLAVFTVDRVERFAKKHFPTRRVYGATARPELRLITCGGAFDASTGHYVDNVVVFAHLSSLADAAGPEPTQEQQ